MCQVEVIHPSVPALWGIPNGQLNIGQPSPDYQQLLPITGSFNFFPGAALLRPLAQILISLVSNIPSWPTDGLVYGP